LGYHLRKFTLSRPCRPNQELQKVKNCGKEIYGIACILILEHDEDALVEAVVRANVMELFQPSFVAHLSLFV